MRKLIHTLAISLAFLATSVSASPILLNGTDLVNALEIDNSFTSFEEFYDYDTTAKWSTALPYAQANTGVYFLASLNGQLALFGLFDAYNSNGTGNGRVTFDYSNAWGSAGYNFIDDSGDAVNGSQVALNWGAMYGDGFVLEINSPDFFELSTIVSNIRGLGNGFKFLSFDDGQNATEVALNNGNVSLQSVPAPAALGLLAIALLGMRLFARKQ